MSEHTNLNHIEPQRKTGDERLIIDGEPIDGSVLDFWRWSGSDLVNNAARGILAEYIVAKALGVAEGIRIKWDPYDLETKDGIRVEVKSAAYCQSWQQKKHSTINFSIAPSIGWDAATDSYDEERKRQADVYVFCLLHHKDKPTLDPLNLDQWSFQVIATEVLNEHLDEQKQISPSTLTRLGAKTCEFSELPSVIRETNCN